MRKPDNSETDMIPSINKILRGNPIRYENELAYLDNKTLVNESVGGIARTSMQSMIKDSDTSIALAILQSSLRPTNLQTIL